MEVEAMAAMMKKMTLLTLGVVFCWSTLASAGYGNFRRKAVLKATGQKDKRFGGATIMDAGRRFKLNRRLKSKRLMMVLGENGATFAKVPKDRRRKVQVLTDNHVRALGLVPVSDVLKEIKGSLVGLSWSGKSYLIKTDDKKIISVPIKKRGNKRGRSAYTPKKKLPLFHDSMSGAPIFR